MPEGIALVRDAVALADGEHLPGHAGVERTLAVAHGNGDGVVARGLVGGRHGIVDGQQLFDLRAEAMRAADADLLADGEHGLERHGGADCAFGNGPEQAQ